MRTHGPERLGGQGLDAHQQESGNAAIHAILSDPVVGDQVDLVVTWRAGPTVDDGAYEVWAKRGMVRFRRGIDEGGDLAFEVLEVVGEDPVADQDPLALATVADERRAAATGGFEADDPSARFVAPAQQSYPYAYERVAQLFDSPNAPDLVVSPKDWCQGTKPGNHGGLHVRQARAPLWLSGPGVRAGHVERAVRAVDIAPTCLAALGFPLVDGADATGRTSSERGAAPDVLLARQDGAVIDDVLDPEAGRPERLYLFLLDGMHPTELADALDRDPDALPNLRRLRDRSAVLAGGSIVNFPSITWPSHTAIATGAWCGHHDVVNPSFYRRETGEVASPQGLEAGTEHVASSAVESIYEAFHRARPGCMTAAVHAPFGRSARHAVLEGRNLCDRTRVKQLTAEVAADQVRRWEEESPPAARESMVDARGVAQVLELFTRDDLPPPHLVYHELALTDGAGHEFGPHSDGLSDALEETDRRIGRVLAVLEETGCFDETLIVVTADHGMAPQDVSLRASVAAHVLTTGMQAVVAEPMIWLRDLAVTVERAADGRTARVVVRANDADADGRHAPVTGAEVAVTSGEDRLATGTTDAGGRYGFATPGHLDAEQITVTVTAPGFNPRNLLLDGTSVVLDLRSALYGVEAAARR